jgi:hypothetical protein
MAAFYVVGNSLLDPDDLLGKNLTRNFETRSDENDWRVASAVSTVDDDKVKARGSGPAFKPIGIGKPLSVEIAAVYTGEYKKFLGGRKDVVVVSGVKSTQTFQSTSRAINLKSENVDEKSFLGFAAFEDGTPIVYYTPAMNADSMLVSFEIMFDNFDTKLFETISGLLNSAAGVPVFLPAAPYLLGGSQLVNIGSKLGDALFSGHPNLAATIPIQFRSPLIPPTEPREYVLYNDRDKAQFSDLKVELVDVGGVKQVRLVNKADNKPYSGHAPYIIILLDGQKREDLASFQPTIASAAILKKFYGAEDKTGEITGVLIDAMKLYNDADHRSKGERIRKQLEKTVKGSEEYESLKALYEAYATNIQTDIFKLPELHEASGEAQNNL